MTNSAADTRSHLSTVPTSADWLADPTGEHRLRYFDGIEWTDHVTHFGPSPCRGCGSLFR